jgi:hypothetical protein
MGIDQYIDRIEASMAEVRPCGYRRSEAKQYIKTVLMLYEREKHEALMDESRNRYHGQPTQA